MKKMGFELGLSLQKTEVREKKGKTRTLAVDDKIISSCEISIKHPFSINGPRNQNLPPHFFSSFPYPLFGECPLKNYFEHPLLLFLRSKNSRSDVRLSACKIIIGHCRDYLLHLLAGYWPHFCVSKYRTFREQTYESS